LPRLRGGALRGAEKLLSHFALQVGGYGYFLELFRGSLSQPRKQLRGGVIALGEEFEYQREFKNGVSDERIVLYLFLSGAFPTTTRKLSRRFASS
jgi:hypothetical protein